MTKQLFASAPNHTGVFQNNTFYSRLVSFSISNHRHALPYRDVWVVAVDDSHKMKGGGELGEKKKEVIAMRDINCHILTFFFFFFLSESCCVETAEVCCCCCCCRCSSSSSSGKRVYCKPGAEKQSFVK